MNPARRQQNCYVLSAIIDLFEPKDFIFGEIIVQVSFFCLKTHRKGGEGETPNALYHRKEGWFFCFLTKYCRLSFTVASQKSNTQTSTLQQSFSTYLTPLCWSMHVVIMLGSFSCSSSLYSILIHFWTFSIIAWINCMNKVSILCLNLS